MYKCLFSFVAIIIALIIFIGDEPFRIKKWEQHDENMLVLIRFLLVLVSMNECLSLDFFVVSSSVMTKLSIEVVLRAEERKHSVSFLISKYKHYTMSRVSKSSAS